MKWSDLRRMAAARPDRSRRALTRRWHIGVILFVATAAWASPAAAAAHRADTVRAEVDERVDLQPLREMYLASVRDEHSIARGLAEVERLRAAARAQPGTPLDATLTAYTGALVTLRAKHAFWPAQKLRYLRQGLAILDRTIQTQPDHAEARYLRLMSCYYLPGILGRGGSVRDDFAALARLLPGVRQQYPPELYGAITRFVVERGRLPAEQRRVLEDTLSS